MYMILSNVLDYIFVLLYCTLIDIQIIYLHRKISFHILTHQNPFKYNKTNFDINNLIYLAKVIYNIKE
jgi:hypothetical protein